MKAAITALLLLACLPLTAHAESTMSPMDDRGRVVIVKPWQWLSEDEKIDQLRSLSTSHCFSYQRLEYRGGSPVCVENRGR